MRTLLASILSALILVLCLAVPAPAPATTVGGHSSWSIGVFTLSAGHVVVPTSSSDDPGEWIGGVPHSDISLLGFGRSERAFGELALDSQSSGYGLDRPALVTPAGRQTAVAWSGAGGIVSALADRQLRYLNARTTTVTAGALAALALAGDPSGEHAVAWSDAAGVHVAAISTAGTETINALVSPALGVRYHLGVVRDARGGWWVVWQVGARLTAVDVAGDGTAGPQHDLGLAGGDVSEQLVADRLGGFWIDTGVHVAHVDGTGVTTTISSPGPVALAAGDGATAIAQTLGLGGVRVRRVGTRLGGWTRLPGHGFVIDVAYDRSLGTVEVLTGYGAGHVRVTHIARSGRITSSHELGSCRDAAGAQILAADGLVAVGCAGPVSDEESVETGGDDRSGRTWTYVLLHHNHVVGAAERFEGDYSY